MTLLLLALSCATTPLVPPAGDSGPELISVADEVRVPRSARRDRISGTWTVFITVDEEGDVVASRMEGLTRDDVARVCTRHWEKSKWRPAWKDGEPVQWDNMLVTCTLALDD